mmetsp:Transcript_20775/g.67247  ORF Transcript_20775/g.67247 Transcript_20775/m.67247 type:complete len:341 (-) Transcript_20775:46-1068(-)
MPVLSPPACAGGLARSPCRAAAPDRGAGSTIAGRRMGLLMSGGASMLCGRSKKGAARARKMTPTIAAGTPAIDMENMVKGWSGASGSFSICELSTRLVEVPMSVHMPPSMEANESGIRSAWTDRPLRAAQPSQTERSMATMGVLFRKADATATGMHSRRTPTMVDFGAPSIGSRSISTARVSSSARATTNRTPITSTDGEETPRQASSLVMTRVSSSSVVAPSSTMSGGHSWIMSRSDASSSHTVQYEARPRHAPSCEPPTTQMGSGSVAITASAALPNISSTKLILYDLNSRQKRCRYRRCARRISFSASRRSPSLVADVPGRSLTGRLGIGRIVCMHR